MSPGFTPVRAVPFDTLIIPRVKSDWFFAFRPCPLFPLPFPLDTLIISHTKKYGFFGVMGVEKTIGKAFCQRKIYGWSFYTLTAKQTLLCQPNHLHPISNLRHNPNPLFHNQIPQQNPTQFPLFHNTFPQLKNKSNPKSKSYLRNRFQKSKLHLPIRKSHLPYPNAFFCLNLQIIHKHRDPRFKHINTKSNRKFHPNQSNSLKIAQYTRIKQYLRVNNKHTLLTPRVLLNYTAVETNQVPIPTHI